MIELTPVDDRRRRWFAVFAVAATLGAAGYVAFAARRTHRTAAAATWPGAVKEAPASLALPASTGARPTPIDPELEALRSGPRIYFISQRDGERGQVVVASLDAPERRRQVTLLRCERAHFGPTRGICLRTQPASLTPQLLALLVGEDLTPRHSFELPGVISRARVSPDESLAALTAFVTGDDYEAEFSTRTKLFELTSGRLLPDIEFFDVYRGGETIYSLDFNYWGVTFTGDGRHAYATLSTSGQTHLVRADLRAREVQTLRENVECPSLSPSGRRLAYKKRASGATGWRLYVLDLDSLNERALPEPRSVDDQVEWLDDDHVLYAVPRDPQQPQGDQDIWVSPAAGGTAAPARRVFVSLATSPAVVRSATPRRQP